MPLSDEENLSAVGVDLVHFFLQSLQYLVRSRFVVGFETDIGLGQKQDGDNDDRHCVAPRERNEFRSPCLLWVFRSVTGED